VKKRLKKEESMAETEYELDEKTGKLKINPQTRRPIAKLEIDPKTGKNKVDPRTGKPIISRKRVIVYKGLESESSTYEVDYLRGKLLRDPTTGAFQLDPKTGRKVKVRRKGGKRVGGYSSHSSDYELNGKTGEKVVKPGRENLSRRKAEQNGPIDFNEDAMSRMMRRGAPGIGDPDEKKGD